MKQHIYAVAVLLYFFSIPAKAQSWLWAQKASGTGNAYGGGIDIDSDGNSYVTGNFYNSISLGSTTLTNIGLNSVYLAKYDVNGTLLWARPAASATNINVHGISVDRSGNISIVGIFSGSGVFGTSSSVSLTSTGDFDVFVARYTAAGDVAWAKKAGDVGFDYGGSISKDATGNIYITGDFHISSFTGSASKIFIAKYDSVGNCAWTKTPYDYSNFHLGNGIKTDSAGNSYFTGQFFTALTFDSTVILDAGNIEANAFIGKITTDGTVLWLQKAGAASGYAGANGIDIDGAGNAFITGFYRGNISFGTLSLAGPSGLSDDIFIAKCNTNGDFVWVNKANGPGATDQGRGVSTDNAGNCYFTGYFNTTITFGATTLTNNGSDDVYVAMADSSGNFVWATQCGGLQNSSIAGIKVNSNGIYITGDFIDTLNFGTTLSLTADSTTSNIFVSKIKGATATLIPENSYPNYSLYPNPVSDEIQFKYIRGTESYVIYDEHGKLIKRGALYIANKISVANLDPGNYFIYLLDKDNREKSTALKFTKS